ncbi:hypothetical protein M9H77_02566 [Catharanthus roseus]|uniref:Uncharacterized protein n=1 Tax=Catharanthus roseus TaxID=4058 RepID=A0ACC0C8X1_CATRO|nr:hypothetical protein M9H77_02566 [Catharanthus roseus]
MGFAFTQEIGVRREKLIMMVCEIEVRWLEDRREGSKALHTAGYIGSIQTDPQTLAQWDLLTLMQQDPLSQTQVPASFDAPGSSSASIMQIRYRPIPTLSVHLSCKSSSLALITVDLRSHQTRMPATCSGESFRQQGRGPFEFLRYSRADDEVLRDGGSGHLEAHRGFYILHRASVE